MLEDPYGPTDPKNKKLNILPWQLVVLIVMVLLVLLYAKPALADKKELPICPKYTLYKVDSPSGTVYLLDQENLMKLIITLEGLRDGKCRLPKLKSDNAKVM